MKLSALFSIIKEEYPQSQSHAWLYECVRYVLENDILKSKGYSNDVLTLYREMELVLDHIEERMSDEMEERVWAYLRILELPSVKEFFYQQKKENEYATYVQGLDALLTELSTENATPPPKKPKAVPRSWKRRLVCWSLMVTTAAAATYMALYGLPTLSTQASPLPATVCEVAKGLCAICNIFNTSHQAEPNVFSPL